SDSEIMEAWKKIQELGISEQEAYQLMESRGMSPVQVNLFKQRIALLSLNTSGLRMAEVNKKEDIDYSRDTTNIIQKPSARIVDTKDKYSLEIYGLSFFNQKSISFEPDFNVATPKGYVVGPGDELIILLTGLNESSVSSKVSPE